MEMNEQAFLSGLVFDNDKDQKGPIWRPSSWPSLLGGNRKYHASIVVRHPSTNHDETVVIVGGFTQGASYLTNSVICLSDDRTMWHEGPPMQEKRERHASVVCDGAVYAIGGNNGFSYLDSIERVPVSYLLHSTLSCTCSANGWTMLNCRLSTKRRGCAAAVVHDRFVVVAGGHNGNIFLSSVDILDTAYGNCCLVISGPSMDKPRSFFGMAVIGQRIYAVGGWRYLNSVEYVEFDELLDKKANSATSMFPLSKSWTRHHDFTLTMSRDDHVVVQVGSCMVVTGAFDTSVVSRLFYSVEVLDAVNNVVWRLPDIRVNTYGCSMVSLSNGITVIGGNSMPEPFETLSLVDKNSWTLSLVDKNSWLFARLLAIGKVPIE